MTKPAGATWGNPAAQVQVEYIKSRRVLRFRPGQDANPVEVPVEDFCRSLGIDVDELVPPRRYMLFAGVDAHAGSGARHVVATFTSEDAARDAFRTLRLAHGEPDDWAEVASVEAAGGLRQLCWFGTPWGERGRRRSVAASNERVTAQPGALVGRSSCAAPLEDVRSELSGCGRASPPTRR